jgi:S1-C subfamily serine protease
MVLQDDKFCGRCGVFVPPSSQGPAVTPRPEQGAGPRGPIDPAAQGEVRIQLISGATRCSNCQRPLPAQERFCAGCGHLRDDLDSSKVARGDDSRVEAAWREFQVQITAATADRYQIVRELGRGGMAVVYLANEIRLKRAVAIKCMAPSLAADPGMVERFAREARTMASLHHPNIATVHAVEDIGHLHFFVMQFVQGRSLDQVIRTGERLPIPAIQAILHQAAAGITYAHKHGVIHRDIKPANIMLDHEGNAIVTDFGIAKVGEYGGTSLTIGPIGTPLYMSPEQCASDRVTPATDQYSLGNVAYELLTGKPPFRGSTPVALGAAIIREKPPAIRPLRPDCPAQIEAAVLKMLAKKPQDRFGSLTEAIAAIGGRPLDDDDPVRGYLSALARQQARPPTPPPSGGAGALPGLRLTLEAMLHRIRAAVASWAGALSWPRSIRLPGKLPRAGMVIAGAVLLVVMIGLIWSSRRYRGERHQASLITNVDSLIRRFERVRSNGPELAQALASARIDLRSLRTVLTAGKQPRQRLDSIARLLTEPSERYPTLSRAATLDPALIPSTAKSAVAIVAAKDDRGAVRWGTGFAVRSRNDTAWIATTRHLLENGLGERAASVGVIFNLTGQMFRAEINRIHDSVDLAILVAPIRGGTPVVKPSRDTVTIGTPVAMIGFPVGLDSTRDWRNTGVAATITVGSIASVVPDHFEIDGYGAKGSSGSPVFTSTGLAVGYVFGAKGAGAERRLFVVPVRVLEALTQ